MRSVSFRTAVWGIVFVLSIVLTYWSWCWGWWGQNRFLQYLLQCNCPSVSEEARYPENVDILFSACLDPIYYRASVSPSGRYAIVYVRRPTTQKYLYDSKLDVANPLNKEIGYIFLTDDLLVSTGGDDGRTFSLYDLSGQRLSSLKRIPVSKVDHISPLLIEAIYKPYKVYVLFFKLMIALSPDLSSSDLNFVLDWSYSSNPYIKDEITDALLKNGIVVETVPEPNILRAMENVYWINSPSQPMVRVPQTLLKIRRDLEEYAPEVRATIEAKRAEEQRNKLVANVVLVVGIILTVGLAGYNIASSFSGTARSA